jgi:hypothetical protein
MHISKEETLTHVLPLPGLKITTHAWRVFQHVLPRSGSSGIAAMSSKSSIDLQRYSRVSILLAGILPPIMHNRTTELEIRVQQLDFHDLISVQHLRGMTSYSVTHAIARWGLASCDRDRMPQGHSAACQRFVPPMVLLRWFCAACDNGESGLSQGSGLRANDCQLRSRTHRFRIQGKTRAVCMEVS